VNYLNSPVNLAANGLILPYIFPDWRWLLLRSSWQDEHWNACTSETQRNSCGYQFTSF